MNQISKGFAASLSVLRWDVFATSTFKNPLPIERRRWRLAWGHLHALAESLGTPYGRLLIALRAEHGELGDRPHFHYLLGGTRASNLHSLCHWLAYDWHKRSQGHLEVRLYNPSLAGADYIEDCLGANSYEVGKFNRADRLEVSSAVFKQVRLVLRSACTHSASKDSRQNVGCAERQRNRVSGFDNPLLCQA